MNALLIEDDDDMQSVVVAFLKRYAKKRDLEVQVRALHDPVQGLFESTTNGSSYDLIMLDVRLPRLTGDEIYQSIMHVNPELLERVLFITAFREDLLSRFPQAELSILDKPFHYAQFESSVAAVLGN